MAFVITTALMIASLAGCESIPAEVSSDNPEAVEETVAETSPIMEISEISEEEQIEEATEDDMQTEEILEDESIFEEESEDIGDSGDVMDVSGDTEDGPSVEKYTADGRIYVDLIFSMGQSNMSGAGGNSEYAPKVPEGVGYEFRAISDPTRLYPIVEPFGVNENTINAIMDLPGAKNGSMVSAFVNRYYELTEIPVVAVSASAGATDTEFWMRPEVSYDYIERLKRAVVWLEASGYCIRHKYVLWLQGESDAQDDVDSDEYEANMDNIIRPMFINGVERVFFITPGRTVSKKDFFNDIIYAQIKMGRESGYYGVASTILSGISTEYMVDEWHYNQKVLNLVGEDAANSVAYYTLNGKEACIYNYKDGSTIIPDNNDYPEDTKVEPMAISELDLMIER